MPITEYLHALQPWLLTALVCLLPLFGIYNSIKKQVWVQLILPLLIIISWITLYKIYFSKERKHQFRNLIDFSLLFLLTGMLLAQFQIQKPHVQSSLPLLAITVACLSCFLEKIEYQIFYRLSSFAAIFTLFIIYHIPTGDNFALDAIATAAYLIKILSISKSNTNSDNEIKFPTTVPQERDLRRSRNDLQNKIQSNKDLKQKELIERQQNIKRLTTNYITNFQTGLVNDSSIDPLVHFQKRLSGVNHSEQLENSRNNVQISTQKIQQQQQSSVMHPSQQRFDDHILSQAQELENLNRFQQSQNIRGIICVQGPHEIDLSGNMANNSRNGISEEDYEQQMVLARKSQAQDLFSRNMQQSSVAQNSNQFKKYTTYYLSEQDDYQADDQQQRCFTELSKPQVDGRQRADYLEKVFDQLHNGIAVLNAKHRVVWNNSQILDLLKCNFANLQKVLLSLYGSRWTHVNINEKNTMKDSRTEFSYLNGFMNAGSNFNIGSGGSINAPFQFHRTKPNNASQNIYDPNTNNQQAPETLYKFMRISQVLKHFYGIQSVNSERSSVKSANYSHSVAADKQYQQSQNDYACDEFDEEESENSRDFVISVVSPHLANNFQSPQFIIRIIATTIKSLETRKTGYNGISLPRRERRFIITIDQISLLACDVICENLTQEKKNIQQQLAKEVQYPLWHSVHLLQIMRDKINNCTNLQEQQKKTCEQYLNSSIIAQEIATQHAVDLQDYIATPLRNYDLSALQILQAGSLNEECDLKRIFQECHEMHRVAAQSRGFQIILDISNRLPKRFTTTPDRLKQLICNLLCTALRNTKSGYIVLRARYRDQGFVEINVIHSISSKRNESITFKTHSYGSIDSGDAPMPAKEEIEEIQSNKSSFYKKAYGDEKISVTKIKEELEIDQIIPKIILQFLQPEDLSSIASSDQRRGLNVQDRSSNDRLFQFFIQDKSLQTQLAQLNQANENVKSQMEKQKDNLYDREDEEVEADYNLQFIENFEASLIKQQHSINNINNINQDNSCFLGDYINETKKTSKDLTTNSIIVSVSTKPCEKISDETDNNKKYFPRLEEHVENFGIPDNTPQGSTFNLNQDSQKVIKSLMMRSSNTRHLNSSTVIEK